jgi:hypothetical protein
MSVIGIEWKVMRAVKRTWMLEIMDGLTMVLPTLHFAKGFADSTPYSQAGPLQKGRSDVSHLNRMEGDVDYLES